MPLNHLYSAFLILATLAGMGLFVGLIYYVGIIDWALGVFGRAVRGSVVFGFRAWVVLLSWADWRGIAGLTLGLLVAGSIAHALDFDIITIVIAASLLATGLITCLAYMYLSFERYEVARGYKAVYNPLKGQDLAADLARYGPKAGVMLLVASAVGTILGFAQLNHALYSGFGRTWYTLAKPDEEAAYLDFLVYALIHLLRVVDVLDLAQTKQYLSVDIVRPAFWPATFLLLGFKSFFTLVLLQQVFAAVREGRLLSETVNDFWSPHAPIHERARVTLPQFGPNALRPMLDSFQSLGPLTKEQRDQIPQVCALMGPSAIPELIRQANNTHEPTQAVVAKALGLLRAIEAVGPLMTLATHESEAVRAAAVEALGLTAEGLRLGPARSGENRPHRGRWVRRLHWIKGLPAIGLARLLPSRWAWRGPAIKLPAAEILPMCVGAIRTALADTSPTVQCEAVTALGRIGPPAAVAVGDLTAALTADADETRRRAAVSLGQIRAGAEIAVPALTAVLTHPSPDVRAAAAAALGEFAGDAAGAVSELVLLLQDREEAVRVAAAEAVNRIGVLCPVSTRLLVNGLASGDNVVRAQTAEALGVIGEMAEEAAPSLVAALTDRNDYVRGKAAEALGKIGEGVAELAVPGLVRLLRDEDNWVRALAAEALGQMGEAAEDAAPALLKSLRHANPVVRANAAEALGRLKAEDARSALESACRDDDLDVRAKAICAVAGLGSPTPATTAVVLAGLTDPGPQVRATAIEAVGGWPGVTVDPTVFLNLLNDGNDEVAVRAIQLAPFLATVDATLPALQARLHGAPNPFVQTAAAITLGRIGPPAAVAGPELAAAAREGDIDLRTAAMRALAQIQPPDAAGVFVAGLRDPDPKIRMVASAGLMKLTALPSDALPAVVEALRDPDEQVRANAAHLLSLLDPVPSEAVPDLINAAATGGDGLRLNAATALLRVSSEAAREALRRLLADPNGRVRLVAAGSLVGEVPTDPNVRAVLTAALDDPNPRLQVIAQELLVSLGPPAEEGAAALVVEGAPQPTSEAIVEPIPAPPDEARATSP